MNGKWVGTPFWEARFLAFEQTFSSGLRGVDLPICLEENLSLSLQGGETDKGPKWLLVLIFTPGQSVLQVMG